MNFEKKLDLYKEIKLRCVTHIIKMFELNPITGLKKHSFKNTNELVFVSENLNTNKKQLNEFYAWVNIDDNNLVIIKNNLIEYHIDITDYVLKVYVFIKEDLIRFVTSDDCHYRQIKQIYDNFVAHYKRLNTSEIEGGTQ